MRVFITGATGWVGEPLVKELIGAGHKVLGLARSDKSAEQLASLGAEVHRGSLDDSGSLKAGAAASDAVIHLAFKHDINPDTFMVDFEATCQADQRAIEAMAAPLAGSNKPLIVTSGTLMVPPGHLATEDIPYDPSSPFSALRGQAETLARSLSQKGVRTSIMRLPPTVHGDGDRGFITALVGVARKKRVSAYIGDGLNEWAAVHRLDAARAYVLALEKGTAGSTYHVVAERVQTKDIAEAIGKGLGVPVESKLATETQEHFGFVGSIFTIDNLVSSKKTKEQLGWNPEHRALLSDILEGSYLKNEEVQSWKLE